MSEEAKVPVFVLPLVVLPGEPLPLHLFEPKYLRMLDHLLEEQQAGSPAEFAICTSQDGEVSNNGCLVQLVHVIDRSEDGRAVILTFGTRPVELIHLDEGGPFPTGTVMFHQEPDPECDESCSKALDLFRELAEVSEDIHAQQEELDDGAEVLQPGGSVGLLSYRLAVSLNLPIKEKLALLEKHSEQSRLTRLIEIMNFDLAASKFQDGIPDILQ